MPEDEILLTTPQQSFHDQIKGYELPVQVALIAQKAGEHIGADWADHAAIRQEVAELRRKLDRLLAVLVGLIISFATAAIALTMNVILGSLKN